MHNQEPQLNRIPESEINALGHILVAGTAHENEAAYNPKIEVFSADIVGQDRAQVYQMLAVDYFASDPVASQALKDFGLSGDDAPEKQKWTQLLEHITGVTANAVHINAMIGKFGGQKVDDNEVQVATLYDSFDKPAAVAIATGDNVITAGLLHDIEKPAEIAAAKETAASGSTAQGLESSRDNPVLRDGRLWDYLHDLGVEDAVILAAQNTGRSDRYYDDLAAYDDKGVKKALEDRDRLEVLLQSQTQGDPAACRISREDIDAMTPDERRMASIRAKGPLATIVGLADAMSAQFQFNGASDESIDAMAAYYKERKPDPESQQFFGQDWPAYYRQAREYLISLVPPTNQEAFAEAFNTLTKEEIFNETVLPTVLGVNAADPARNAQAMQALRYDSPK